MSDIERTMQREVKILQSGVREYFTPHHPIDAVSQFRGRYEEVERCVSALSTPGQHMVIFGERGVGKSSLANVACDLLLTELIGAVSKFLCSSADSFSDLWGRILADLGHPGLLAGESTERNEGSKAGLDIGFAKTGIDTHKRRTQSYVPVTGATLNPSNIAEFLVDKDVLIVIDEVELLASDTDRQLLAETIKQLSDGAAKAKVLLVGIAEAASEIVASHPSVGRCLLEIHLLPMAPEEIEDIIVKGADKCELTFDDDVTSAIVAMSAGYPYFAHLLALKCAEEAVAADCGTVDASMLETAINGAVQDAEGTLRSIYLSAVRTYAAGNPYAIVASSAAHIGKQEFNAAELRQAIKDHAGLDMKQASLNNYLQRLVAKDDSAMLRRVAKGVYRFSDPRMPAFVRIIEKSSGTPSQTG